MTRPGRQLSELLWWLGGGRAPVPPGPPRPRDASGTHDLSGRRGLPDPSGVELPVPGRSREVLASLGRGAVQVDGTTCGSAALVLTAAVGDDVLARELARPGAAEVAQRRTKGATTRHALLGLPWPGALGTPPWAAARAARCGTVRYTHRLVVDSRPQSVPLLDAAVAWARAGVPVPLYTGGDTRSGLAAAVPRHVVVLTSPDGSALEVYEPSSGRLHPVTEDHLRSGGVPRPSLGGWSHVTWVLLPLLPAPGRTPV